MPKREPAIYLTRRGKKLIEALIRDMCEFSEEVSNRLVELTFRRPLYVQDEGKYKTLVAEPTGNKETIPSIRGYLGQAVFTGGYGSPDDCIAVYKDPIPKQEPKIDPEMEKAVPLEEVRRQLEEEAPLEDRIRGSLGISFKEPPTTPMTEEEKEIMDAKLEDRTKRAYAEFLEKFKEELRTNPACNGCTVVYFSEIKDWKVIT